MPVTEVFFYCDDDGKAPVVDWLVELTRTNRKAAEKCQVRIETLRQMGYELRRPIADMLRDGIYELRAQQGTVQYRILYFFHGKNIAVLAHGFTKEKKVPPALIEESLNRKRRFEQEPEKHTYREKLTHGNDN